MPQHSETDRQVPTGAIWAFVALTFALSWGSFALFLSLPEEVAALFGPQGVSHPVFILAVYAPALSAVLLVLWTTGPGGLLRFLGRFLIWRAPLAWWLVLLVGLPLCFLLGAFVKGTLWPYALPFDSAGALFGAMGFMLILGPVEEFGWRGVALPLLQRRMAPVWAGLLVGILWGVWHLPAFFLEGTPQSSWTFVPFFVGAVSVSLIVTPMFNATRGSVLLPFLVHFQLNNPVWPDAQPHDTWFFAAAAALTLWLCRGTMFRRAGAVTVVVPPPGRPA